MDIVFKDITVDKSFGAYYQVYKNPFATYMCLLSFRKLYPLSTIVLLSDNGYNYTEMAKYFNCIYIYSNEQIYYIRNITDDYIVNFTKLIKRFCDCMNLIKEDYIMWLEDDVSINKIVNDNLINDINGYCPNNLFINNKQILSELLNDFPNLNINSKFTGHGGSIYNKLSIYKYLSNTEIVLYLLTNWEEFAKYGFTSNICQDYLFSMICVFSGGTIGNLNSHFDDYKLNTNISVQHQFKIYYSLDMPSELKYLYSIN